MGEVTEKRRRHYSGLDADKATIPAAGKAVGDRFFATDTKIYYFWDGVGWIIIPLDVIIAGMLQTDCVETAKIKNINVTAAKLATNSVETAKIKDLNVTKGKAELGFGRYVPRAVTALDFDQTDFTINSAWHVDGLDLSGIVPVGAVAVHLQLYLKDDAVASSGQFRANATTKVNNLMQNCTVVANQWTVYMHGILYIDADRLADYYFTTGMDNVGVIVLGWFI